MIEPDVNISYEPSMTVQHPSRKTFPSRSRPLAWVGLPLFVGGLLLVAGEYEVKPAQASTLFADTKPRTEGQSPANPEAAEQSPDIQKKAASEPLIQGLGSYLAAREASRSSDTQAAATYFAQALAANPKDSRLQKEAIKAYMMAGDIKHANELAQKVKASGEKNQLASMVSLVTNAQSNRFDIAQNDLKKIDAVGMLVLIKPFIAAWLETARSGEIPPIEISEQLRKTNFFDSFMYYQKALMSEMLKQDQQARENFSKATQKLENLPYRIAIAYIDFLLKNNEKANAVNFCQQWMDANPENILMQGVSAAEVVNDLAARKNTLIIANTNQGLAELMLATANMLYSQEATTETLLYLRFALALRPDFGHAQLLLANMLEDSGKPKEALDIYSKITGDMGVERRAGIRRAFTLESLGQAEEAMKVLASLEKRFPLCSDIAVAQGDILRKQNHYESAVNAYTRAINISGSTTEKHWPLFYVRGISYERSGEWNLAEKDFRTALKLAPEQPDVLNYLAYSWLVQRSNLEEARDMLERAVAARPDDPHIIDSMGWAYFVLGDFKNAVEYLDQAAELMPGDVTVNEHLGDALWRVGRKNEARFQWQRALTFKPEAAVSDAINKKLLEGLPAYVAPKAPIKASSNSSKSKTATVGMEVD